MRRGSIAKLAMFGACAFAAIHTGQSPQAGDASIPNKEALETYLSANTALNGIWRATEIDRKPAVPAALHTPSGVMCPLLDGSTLTALSSATSVATCSYQTSDEHDARIDIMITIREAGSLSLEELAAKRVEDLKSQQASVTTPTTWELEPNYGGLCVVSRQTLNGTPHTTLHLLGKTATWFVEISVAGPESVNSGIRGFMALRLATYAFPREGVRGRAFGSAC